MTPEQELELIRNTVFDSFRKGHDRLKADSSNVLPDGAVLIPEDDECHGLAYAIHRIDMMLGR